MTGDDRLTEAAHHAAHALADARARLLRLRAACDFGIARIEAGEAPPPLAMAGAPTFAEDARGVVDALAAVTTLRAVFGEALDAPTREALAVRLGGLREAG